MRRTAALLTSVLFLASCAQKETPVGTAPHATVQLRDGSRFTGNVVASSPSEVTIEGDDKARRTLAMRDVKAIEYDDATPAPAPSPAGSVASTTPAPVSEPDLNHERHVHPTEARVTTRTYEVAAGTPISVRLEETIDSAKASEGQTFAAEVTQNVQDTDGGTVIPRNANAKIVIRSASKGGRFKGTSDLVLDLASVAIDGREYQVETVNLVRKGKPGMGANKRTATFTGGGAALGAIIGAIAGGGKGAAIGAAAGAGAGATTQVVTKGESIRIPVESVLTFRLEEPLRVTARQ